ncbi:MAG: pyruvate, phosphate dikinase [Magnetococcales bacterium]|nr:pyruvate, phosphate dikinase [Magnetococcales bacterium]
MVRNKQVFFFGDGLAEGDADMRTILGGKGANLAEMTRIGIPVPAGFTIGTQVCNAFLANREQFPPDLQPSVESALAWVEKTMDARFGDPENPLLVSVRSGARASMPGMMDTVLNLGLNDAAVKGLIKKTNNPRFAYDSYRRFIQMYGEVVLGVEHHLFEEKIQALKKLRNKERDVDLTAEDWQELASRFKEIILQETGKPLTEDPHEQLWAAIGAVFKSWNIPRAITYRRLHHIPDHWGTAVNVQAMVYGNMGDDCATGVAFTRDPATGENRFYGEYLINAQGEDVVAGIRTPQQITVEGKERNRSDLPAMEETMPELYKELRQFVRHLETHYRDMQDLEFTIQNNRLWILQTRNGKRTTEAALTIAVDMVKEGLITREEAIRRLDPTDLDQILHPTLDPVARADKPVLTTGLPASPGAASGQVVFNAEDAVAEAEAGRDVILVRDETNPEDIQGMHAAKGIVTARGGMTSHAAVVARGMGRPCVSGCVDLRIDFANERFNVGSTRVKKGDWLTMDGASGEIMVGRIATRDPEPSEDFTTFMSWADGIRRMGVRANADTPEDARIARKFGAEGIGLCRTEHMFFQEERILAVREMILAQDEAGRRAALQKILPMQRGDFEGLFREMQGLPVTIRLLDPPLHEFIPRDEKGQAEVANSLGLPISDIRERVEDMKEFNPMLGHRGCRLGITYPEIYEMQVRAIMEAACDLVKNEGFTITPEIMIPLVGHNKELEAMRRTCQAECDLVQKEKGVTLKVLIGTMIELPRAALAAGRLAQSAEFFSFGTNDLTQTTLGISRDDAGIFLMEYVDKGIIPQDPFVTVDRAGVGQLIKIAVQQGRITYPEIKLGICGEHGGDPASIAFFEQVGLDYVSCSPFRVYIARLAAAQASLGGMKDTISYEEQTIKLN